MAPLQALARLATRTADPAASFTATHNQWHNPNDILSILMIIGGDIVQRALAALSASTLPCCCGIAFPLTPVAFSFGWVAYAFSAILSAVGDRTLMPDPDCSAVLVNVRSGYSRPVSAWALARLVRDYEPPAHLTPEERTRREQLGLTVSFVHTVSTADTGRPVRDWVFYSGIVTIVLQLGIASIPGALNGNWIILVLTAGGNLLALLTGALPQWAAEKSTCARLVRPGQREVVCLTRGNGSKSVIVVSSNGCGRRLEDLAASSLSALPAVRSEFTAFATFVLTLCWLVHLVTTESISADAWYMLCVGALGMLQNVVAAGARRTPAALGFHVRQGRVVWAGKVFRALQAAEEVERGVGLALLRIFFPGGLREDEEAWRVQTVKENKEAERKEKEERAQGTARDVASGRKRLESRLVDPAHRERDSSTEDTEWAEKHGTTVTESEVAGASKPRTQMDGVRSASPVPWSHEMATNTSGKR